MTLNNLVPAGMAMTVAPQCGLSTNQKRVPPFDTEIYHTKNVGSKNSAVAPYSWAFSNKRACMTLDTAWS